MLLNLLADQPPTDFWHDSLTLTILSILGVILAAIIGAVIAVYIFRKQTVKKLLSYQIVSNAPIANFNNTSKNTVEIKINDKVVTNPRQVVLKLRNQGNVAINTGDYANSLGFSFTGSKFIGSDVIETRPPELKNSITPPKMNDFIKSGTNSTDSIELKNILLNANESITFTILLDGDYTQLDRSGRIVNGEIVKYSDMQSPNSYRKRIVSNVTNFISYLGIGGLAYSLFSIQNSIGHLYTISTFSLVILALSIVLISVPFVSTLKDLFKKL